MPGEPIIYRIDAEDRIVECNDAWSCFARANYGEQSLPDWVIGKPIWDVVLDPTLRELYRRMIAQARAGRLVRFRCRCDAPSERRIFRMTLCGHEEGVVEFTSEVESCEPRPEVTWLRPHESDGRNLVRLCSWCARVFVHDRGWVSIEQAIEWHSSLQLHSSPRLTHGMCESCRDEMLRLIENPAVQDLNRLPR